MKNPPPTVCPHHVGPGLDLRCLGPGLRQLVFDSLICMQNIVGVHGVGFILGFIPESLLMLMLPIGWMIGSHNLIFLYIDIFGLVLIHALVASFGGGRGS